MHAQLGQVRDATTRLEAPASTFEGRLQQPHRLPQLVDAPFELWMDIMTRKADGPKLFMERKYAVKGDIAILMRMGEFFG